MERGRRFGRGVEAAIGAAGAQAARQRSRRAAEKGAVRGVVGVAEVRVLEDLEELGSKTKPHAVLAGN